MAARSIAAAVEEILFTGVYLKKVDAKDENGTARVFGIRISLLTAFLVITIAVSVFSSMFTHSFVDYDDYRMIVNRIDAYDGFTMDNIKNILFKDYPREEPLIVRDISYLINASLFGSLNPKGYLLGNLLLHIAVSYLVFILAISLFPNQYLLAILSAVFFTIHPLHVESVVWISSRKDPLYVFFYLTALFCYIRSFKNNRFINLFFSMFFFCCALFSKSAAISFLPLILSYRITLKRSEAICTKEIVYYILIVMVTVLFIFWYTGVLTEFGVIKKSVFKDRDWWIWGVSSVVYMTFYMQKLIVPTNLSLLYDYPAPSVLFDEMYFVIISILISCLSGIGLIFLWLKKNNELVFLGLFFICALLPYLDLAQVNIFVANRYAYLASVAFCIVIAYAVLKIVYFGRSIRYISPVIASVVVFYASFLAVQTFNAIKPWENTISLWENAMQVAPNMSDTYTGLMTEYMNLYLENPHSEKGMLALLKSEEIGKNAVLRFCDKAQKLCPVQVDKIMYHLGQINWINKNYDLADKYFESALRLNPLYYEAKYMYAQFLIQQGRIDEAIEHIKFIKRNANPYMDRDTLDSLKYLDLTLNIEKKTL